MLLAIVATQCRSSGTAPAPALPDPTVVPVAAPDAKAPAPPPERPQPPGPTDVGANAPADVPAEVALDPEAVEQRRLEGLLQLPFYPKARRVVPLCAENTDNVRVVLETDDPLDSIVRFYERHTGVTALQTELSTGTVFDIVLDRNDAAPKAGGPRWFVQVKPVPPALRGEVFQARHTILLDRRQP